MTAPTGWTAAAASARWVCHRGGRRVHGQDQSQDECGVSHFTPLSMVPVSEMYVPALVASAMTIPLGGMI